MIQIRSSTRCADLATDKYSIRVNTVIISSHVLLPGAAHALRDYLLAKKPKKLLFISLPLIDQKISQALLYRKGKLVSEKGFKRYLDLGLFDYLIDVIWTIYHSLKVGKIDLFVGIDPLNSIVGILLRKLGRVQKVIYYGIDFVPIRFENKLMNHIFHLLEAYCVKNSDEVWNVSDRMSLGREKHLGINLNKYPQKTVPIGVYIHKAHNNFIKTSSLLFVGHLVEKQGVQMALDAVPLIIKKIPKFKFIIVGGGEYEKNLKDKSRKLKIDKYVEFRGWVTDRVKLDSIMLNSALAIACYKPEKEKLRNFTYYADPTKIKDYLNFSLPIVMTDVSHNSRDIVQKECGIIVKYNKEDIAAAIIKLLNNEKQLLKYKNNAHKYIKNYEWSKVFKNAFNE